tara:strand:+ start:130 stop:306 length:177 start_codon:yes stop_codon:yes gene_type:complete
MLRQELLVFLDIEEFVKIALLSKIFYQSINSNKYIEENDDITNHFDTILHGQDDGKLF